MKLPYIIAEVGSNWKTETEALNAISSARAAGADAVKFQYLTTGCLYGYNPPELFPSWPLLSPQLTEKLSEKAESVGLDFLCTAFSPRGVTDLDPYVPIHKIASSDLNHVKLLERAGETGKPILLSTGASGPGDINLALQVLRGCDVTLMYCNSAYPSRCHNLFMIPEMREQFGRPVGFSDHSIDIYTPLSAWRHFDTPVIEKHFNPNWHSDTPDAPHSISTAEFSLMVDWIRGTKEPTYKTHEERDMITRHNRRLIATRDINIGTLLQYNVNYGAYRSLKDDTRGYSPFLLRDTHRTPEGKAARKPIKAGDSIGPGDF